MQPLRPVRQFITVVLLCLTQQVLGQTVLYRGNGAEPETLDIHRSSGVTEACIQRDLFEGLLAEAADGKLIPGVATHWQISDDGLQYDFTLRSDARWSDGSPVTSADFVYAFERALNPTTASDYAFILWPIKGAEAYSKGQLKDPAQLGIKAVNPHRLQITLHHPAPYFLQLLTHHMAYPAPRRAIEAHGRRWTRPGHLISNGPYQLSEWLPQAHIRLQKNPYFHAADSVKINAVVYLPTEDKNAELKRFRAGELQITEDVPATQIPWIKTHLAAAFHSSPYIGTYYYAFNLSRPPFAEQPKLRKALTLAIDRNILTNKVTQGGEIPAYGWVPPGIPGYTPQALEEAGLSQAERIQKAQRLYAESGYSKANPLRVELLYNTSDNHKKVAIAIAAMWKQALGVKTTLRNEEWKVYLDSRKQREFQIIRAGWIGDYNDAYSFLSLFKSDVGDMNPSAYHNVAFDQFIQRAETTAEPRQRNTTLQLAEQQLLDDLPILPIYFYTTQHLVDPRIIGWVDNIMDVHPTRFLTLP